MRLTVIPVFIFLFLLTTPVAAIANSFDDARERIEANPNMSYDELIFNLNAIVNDPQIPHSEKVGDLLHIIQRSGLQKTDEKINSIFDKARALERGEINPTFGITKKVDEFDGTITYSAKSMAIGRSGALDFFPTISIVPNTRPSILFILMAKNETWQYLDCHRVDILVNGKPVRPDKVAHNADVRGWGVTEFITAFMNSASFSQITEAQTVKGRVCNDIFELSQDHLNVLKALGKEAGILK